ncbi:hypothetical protein FGADI_5343 [Fusarium gaditjirri]|uniref:Xylanolytic transcriptional activator regulatory domain-containing protein n=1 Tax=Fusarium gaditjirri TaxID=282569 RepID=A0A8H4WY69_9HYPO|nr:hypothetical protein FGADI_5343 [Fusarium gaditjirri]
MGFPTAPKPKTLLGFHRILSPTAGVKVSPICLGGISIGHEWKFYTGKNEEPFTLLDAFYETSGNFVDTASNYNNQMSETLIGQWMEERGVRDQMVIATKYTAGYRAFGDNPEPLQSNLTGNSAKSMHISVRDSLKKLKTDYIDVLYVHWWDYATPVEEVMGGLHVLVMQGKVLYLGIGNTPAWIVMKANASWLDSLLADRKGTTLQAIALAYLFHQSTYVFPIVGVNTVEHIKAMPEALKIKLTKEHIDEIHEASPYNPGYPMNFTQQWITIFDKFNKQFPGLVSLNSFTSAFLLNSTPEKFGRGGTRQIHYLNLAAYTNAEALDGTGAALQSQVQSLETSLDEAQQRIKELEGRLSQKSSQQSDQVQVNGYDVSSSGKVSHESSLELPPQHEVLSGVNKFLTTFNTILPLFHPQRLLSRVNAWYEQPHQRDASSWAAINVVLALAYRHIPDEEKPRNYSTLHFMNRAQSVLNDIMLGESNLLDVQTIVGMVVLLQATSDLKPASALVPIALRLAHGLGLHTRSKSEYLSPIESLEQDRVFWIAYILDRDIAMRTKLPPIQSQNDISIDWPSATPTDGAGMLYTADSSSSFNFFLSRAQLAHIQGEVYEAMLSKSPTASDFYVRLENVTRIHRMLDDWLSRIPDEFSPIAITQSGNTNLQRAFGVLYSSHLTCRSVVCKAHAMEAQWIPSLQDFGRKAVEQGLVTAPRLPVGWHKLVHESREYIELFIAIDHKDPAFIW